MDDTRKFQKKFGEASLCGGLTAVVTDVCRFPEGIVDRADCISTWTANQHFMINVIK